MIVVGSIALLRPWWLVALPVVVALYLLTRPRSGALAGWNAASDPHLLAAMVARGGAAATRARAPAVLLTLVAAVLALAGPAVRRHDGERLRNLDATVLVMDASQRMADGGLIREAASAAHDLLGHLGARQVALVVYAGDAYVASALTDFTGAIDTDLFALDDGTVPDPGSRPDRALVAAGRLLDEAHIIAGDVVLVTAGGGLEGTAAIRAAAALAAAGRRVYAMSATGAAAGNAARRDARMVGQVAAVAAAGGGFAVDMADPRRLADTLADRTIDRTGSSVVKALDWRDLGRLLMIAAAVPLLLGFRKPADA